MLDELSLLNNPRVVGVVLDVTGKIVKDVSRIEAIKNALTNVLLRQLQDSDVVYMATDADNDYMPTNLGVGMARIADWVCPVSFNAGVVMQHTVSMVGQREFDSKYIIYITDRFLPHTASHIKQALDTDLHQRYKCKFALVDLGGRYATQFTELAAGHPDARAYQMPILDLFEPLIEELLTKEKYGESDRPEDLEDETD